MIFVFTKIERPFLCPPVLPDHCSDMWQTAYFKPDKSALKDLKDQVLVCSYYKKGACGDLGMTWDGIPVVHYLL